jgi:hypothetical protein
MTAFPPTLGAASQELQVRAASRREENATNSGSEEAENAERGSHAEIAEERRYAEGTHSLDSRLWYGWARATRGHGSRGSRHKRPEYRVAFVFRILSIHVAGRVTAGGPPSGMWRAVHNP